MEWNCCLKQTTWNSNLKQGVKIKMNNKGMALPILFGVVGIVALIGILFASGVLADVSLVNTIADRPGDTPEGCQVDTQTLNLKGEYTVIDGAWGLFIKPEVEEISVTRAYFGNAQLLFGAQEIEYEVTLIDDSTGQELGSDSGEGTMLEGGSEVTLPYNFYFQAQDTDCDGLPEDDAWTLTVTVGEQSGNLWDFFDDSTLEHHIELINGQIIEG